MRKRTTQKKLTKQADIVARLRIGATLYCTWDIVSGRQRWDLKAGSHRYPCLTRPCAALEQHGRIRKIEEWQNSSECHETWVLA